MMEVSVPVTVVVLLTTAEGVPLFNSKVKSGTGEVTFAVKVLVLAAGAPLVVAETVIVEFPRVAPAAAVMVKVTVTGTVAVGLTEALGEKWQVMVDEPVQASATAPLNDPAAVTWKVLEAVEVVPCCTMMVPGEIAPKSKSTTCSTAAASCTMPPVSEPTP